MSILRRLLVRPRLLAEVRFVFGGALVGAAAGLVLAVLFLPPSLPGFQTSPLLARWVRAIAPGFGYGWWGGLLWSTFLALAARRSDPPAPVDSLGPATWVAASVAVVAGALSRWFAVRQVWGVLAGIGFGTLAARGWIARAAARAARQ
jgi:hypothetical protein